MLARLGLDHTRAVNLAKQAAEVLGARDAAHLRRQHAEVVLWVQDRE